MLQFRIGSIPVVVHPSHLLVAALLSWSWLGVESAPDTQTAVLTGLGGVVVVFVSILVHELGHAFAMKAFGYQPSVVIEWFGGHTNPNTHSPIPWLKDVVLTFAGPLAGLMVGVLAFVGLAVLTPGEGIRVAANEAEPIWIQLLAFAGVANVVWTALNLVPVVPLDGGRISHAVFTAIFKRRGVLFSHGLSLVISVGAAVASVTLLNQPFLAFFMAMFAFRSFQVLQAYFRGQDTSSAPAPSDLAFTQAAALFQQGELEQARRLAQRALQMDPPPSKSMTNRLHHLLGWIAIKDGDGREALGQFARLEGEKVEAHALAAAFSLAGDDERALELWELAARSSDDDTLRHEYAGALIRRGRVEEARRLPKIDMLAAWRAAERVLSIRGDYEGAARIGSQALAEFPRADLAYDTACAWARVGKIGDAQRMLERATELGFRDASHAAQDPDLDALRSTGAFQSWLGRLQESRLS